MLFGQISMVNMMAVRFILTEVYTVMRAAKDTL